MQVLIIADDLTGALDTAAPFSTVGLKTVVAPSRADLPVAIVNTKAGRIFNASSLNKNEIKKSLIVEVSEKQVTPKSWTPGLLLSIVVFNRDVKVSRRRDIRKP